MKKLFCFIAFALAMLVTVSAQAQMKIQSYVGGSVSISVEGSRSTSTQYNIEHEGTWAMGLDAGCFFTDKCAAGISGNFIVYMGEEGLGSITLSPYFRYRYYHKDNLSLIVDFYAKCERIGGGFYNYGMFGAGVRPGLMYGMTDHWSLVFGTGVFEYCYSTERKHYFRGGFDILNPTIGLYYTM